MWTRVGKQLKESGASLFFPLKLVYVFSAGLWVAEVQGAKVLGQPGLHSVSKLKNKPINKQTKIRTENQ